jgi:hypothetical protein
MQLYPQHACCHELNSLLLHQHEAAEQAREQHPAVRASAPGGDGAGGGGVLMCALARQLQVHYKTLAAA